MHSNSVLNGLFHIKIKEKNNTSINTTWKGNLLCIRPQRFVLQRKFGARRQIDLEHAKNKFKCVYLWTLQTSFLQSSRESFQHKPLFFWNTSYHMHKHCFEFSQATWTLPVLTAKIKKRIGWWTPGQLIPCSKVGVNNFFFEKKPL